MGRPRSAIWASSELLPPPVVMKTPRSKCLFCSATVSASAHNMDSHYRNCSSVQRVLAALIKPNDCEKEEVSPFKASTPASSAVDENKSASYSACRGPLGSLITSVLSTNRRSELDVQFSRSVYETATPSRFFDHPYVNISSRSYIWAGNPLHQQQSEGTFWMIFTNLRWMRS